MKLTVAMITYNQERFIAQAIERVLAQKVNFEYEIVVGEDCSTDGTCAIVTEFSRRYPNHMIPLLREHNREVHGTFTGRWPPVLMRSWQFIACIPGAFGRPGHRSVS